MQIRDAKIQAKEIVAQALAKANDIDTEGGTNVDYVVRESLDSTKPKAIKSFHPKVHQGGCTSLRFDPSGSMLASSGLDKLCRVWDPTTFKEKMVLRVRVPLLLLLNITLQLPKKQANKNKWDLCKRIRFKFLSATFRMNVLHLHAGCTRNS